MTVLAACEPADDVRVQALPPLERPSAEARAGLPEVAGLWRFAGWELAEGDSASLDATLPALGQLALETQRLDSIAGRYVTQQGSIPLVGEVRRDGVLALVAPLGGESRYLAGRVSADTLWLSTSSLVEPGSWPGRARVAFVRTRVASPFVRLQGAPTVPAVDSTLLAAADSLPTATPAPAAGDAPPAVAPAAPVQTAPARTAPQRAEPARPEPRQPPAREQAQPARPQPTPPAPEPARPVPEPVRPDSQPRRRPPLLGEPVRDTTRDTTYVPLVLRASARPGSVSSSR